jgi:hypothetical protein
VRRVVLSPLGRGRDLVEGVEDALGGGQPVGAGVEQGGHRAHGGEQLGDQEQDGEGGAQVEAAGDQADPEGHGHQGGRQGGGQVQDDAGQERQPQGGHGGAPVAVGDLADPGDLGAPTVEGPQGRQAPDHVEEPGREPDQGLEVGSGAGAGRAADEGHEHRDHRQGHGHDQRRGEVDGGAPAEHGRRDHDRQDHLGQVAGEVGLQAVDPLDGGGGQGGAVAPPGTAGARPQAALDQLGPQGRHHPGGRAPPAHLDHLGQPGPGGHDRRQRQRGRHRDPVQPAFGGGGDHGRQQGHLGQQEQGRRQPGGDADGQGRAGHRHPSE